MAFAYLPKGRKTYHIGYHDPVTGKFKHESARTKNLAEAKKKAKNFTAAKQLGMSTGSFIKANDPITLLEGFQLFISHRKFAPKTIELYNIAFKHLISAVGDKPINRVTQQDFTLLSRYLHSHKATNPRSTEKNPIAPKPLSQNSISTYLRQLSTVFNFFVLNGYLTQNIIKKVKPVQKVIKLIPPSVLSSVFSDIEKTNVLHYQIIKLKYLAALRVGELTTLSVSDIDLTNRRLLIHNQKAGRPDIIPIPQDLYNHLLSINIPSDGLLFPGLTINMVKSAWRRSFVRLNLKFYNIHLLRKTRGTQLAESGVSPFMLRDFMRHTSVKVTEKYYLNINIEKTRQEIDKKLGEQLST